MRWLVLSTLRDTTAPSTVEALKRLQQLFSSRMLVFAPNSVGSGSAQ